MFLLLEVGAGARHRAIEGHQLCVLRAPLCLARPQACYLVREVGLSLWRPVPERSKDYIAAPKANGYQSLHLTVRLPRGSRSSTSSTSSSASSQDSEDQAVVVLGMLDSSGTGSSGGAGASTYTSTTTSSSSSTTTTSGPTSTSGTTISSSSHGPTLELQIRTQAMHEQAEGGEAAHAAYKGGLDAAQARQLKAWTGALLGSTSLPAAVALSGGEGGGVPVGSLQATLPRTGSIAPTLFSSHGSSTAEAAAEGLFRHMDRNGDGRISLGEVQELLAELGVAEGEVRAAAAREVLRAAGVGHSHGSEAGDSSASSSGGSTSSGLDGSMDSFDSSATISYDQFLGLQREVGGGVVLVVGLA